MPAYQCTGPVPLGRAPVDVKGWETRRTPHHTGIDRGGRTGHPARGEGRVCTGGMFVKCMRACGVTQRMQRKARIPIGSREL